MSHEEHPMQHPATLSKEQKQKSSNEQWSEYMPTDKHWKEQYHKALEAMPPARRQALENGAWDYSQTDKRSVIRQILKAEQNQHINLFHYVRSLEQLPIESLIAFLHTKAYPQQEIPIGFWTEEEFVSKMRLTDLDPPTNS